jgi:hypothetical protein
VVDQNAGTLTGPGAPSALVGVIIPVAHVEVATSKGLGRPTSASAEEIRAAGRSKALAPG